MVPDLNEINILIDLFKTKVFLMKTFVTYTDF